MFANDVVRLEWAVLGFVAGLQNKDQQVEIALLSGTYTKINLSGNECVCIFFRIGKIIRNSMGQLLDEDYRVKSEFHL